jgi:dienelactone hydrolase
MSNLISIDSHGTAIQTELFRPAGASNRGAIVVAHGSDGMTGLWAGQIREYATELAAEGFTALIPNYFTKTATVPGPQVFSEMQAHLPAWQEAVSDTLTWSATLPGINRLGLLGFSLGGHISLRLRGSVKALVEFFAPDLRELGGVGPAGTSAPHVQIHHGLADSLVPFSDAEAIAATLKHEGVVPELFSYQGAGHGFAGADPNNVKARSSSKDRTLAFFSKRL